jgi:hypothetical protein
MTNLAQVRHVMMKDFRESRWLLAVYLCVTALATAHALGVKGFDGEGAGYLMILVVVVGMIVAASLVQGDSPIRADAFWATRPLNPPAVLAAKLVVVAIIVIGIPAIGELGGLITHHVAARDLPVKLATSIWEYGRWLLIALVIGGVTRDLRAVVLTLIAIPLFFVLMAVWSSMQTPSDMLRIGEPGFTLPLAIRVAVFVAGGGALLWHLYRTRDARPRTWIAGFAVFLAGIWSVGPDVATATFAEAPTPVPRATFKVGLARYRTEDVEIVPGLAPLRASNSDGNPRIALRLELDSPPSSQRLGLISGVGIFRLRDGTVLRQPIIRQSMSRYLQVRDTTGLHWLGEPADARFSTGFSVSTTDGVQRAIEAGVTAVGLDGRILVSTPDAADTVPLVIGAYTTRSGSRATVTKWEYGLGRAALTLSTSAVMNDVQSTLPGPFDAEESDFALINEARHEAIALEMGGLGYHTGWLVMPGNPTRDGSLTLQTSRQYARSVERGGAPLDDAWFRSAHLVITHWVRRGSYAVHSEGSVP